MTVVVASGKGGTGKTTVSVGLARAIGTSVTLLDCDVEAPNTALFLTGGGRPERRGEQGGTTERFTIRVPRIDPDRCTTCGACADFCAFGALVTVRDQVLLFADLCHACGGCARVCPTGAIDETPHAIGTIVTTRYDGILHVSGELDVGQTLAPPLIRAVKAAGDPNDAITIIDAAPGTTCPVVEAVRGADVGLLVTENTPFGLHDLELAAQVLADRRVPSGIVINRAGFGYEDESLIRAISERFGFPILLRIAFDESIARGYADGESIVASVPRLRDDFLRLRDELVSLGRAS